MFPSVFFSRAGKLRLLAGIAGCLSLPAANGFGQPTAANNQPDSRLSFDTDVVGRQSSGIFRALGLLALVPAIMNGQSTDAALLAGLTSDFVPTLQRPSVPQMGTSSPRTSFQPGTKRRCGTGTGFSSALTGPIRIRLTRSSFVTGCWDLLLLLTPTDMLRDASLQGGPRPLIGKFAMKPFLAQGAFLASQRLGNYSRLRPVWPEMQRILAYREDEVVGKRGHRSVLAQGEDGSVYGKDGAAVGGVVGQGGIVVGAGLHGVVPEPEAPVVYRTGMLGNADLLDLDRVGKVPIAKFMSTALGRSLSSHE